MNIYKWDVNMIISVNLCPFISVKCTDISSDSPWPASIQEMAI